MSALTDPSFARGAQRALAAREGARATVDALARLADGLDPERGWPARLALPLEREVEMLARALLERFEAEHRDPRAAELCVALHVTDWHGAPDGCELDLGPDRERFASPLLARVVRAAPDAPGWAGRELALACAAALVQEALARIDPELALGAAGALHVSVAFPGGARLALGSYAGEWGRDAPRWSASS